MLGTLAAVIAVVVIGVSLGMGGASSLRAEAARQTSGGVTRSDGAERLYAAALPASAQNPAFSPDGSMILFTQWHQGYNRSPAGMYRLSLNTNEVVRLVDEPPARAVNLPGASWNGPANRIVFSSDRQERRWEIWTMDPDGQSLFRVTDHQASHPRYAFLEPSLSPDGEWIVFEAAIQVMRAEEHSSIYKVRSNGAELTRLTNGDSGDFEDRQPNWSPQGNRILFQRRLRGSDEWNLYTMSPSGTDLRRVTTARSAGTDASWSPDGRWIVYSSENGALPMPNIHIVSADGGDPIRVTYSDRHEDSAPSWSSDGRWIAFESHVSEDPDSPSALWRIAAPLDRLR